MIGRNKLGVYDTDEKRILLMVKQAIKQLDKKGLTSVLGNVGSISVGNENNGNSAINEGTNILVTIDGNTYTISVDIDENLDFNLNEAIEIIIEKVNSLPTPSTGEDFEGRVIFLQGTGEQRLYYHDGTNWFPIDGEIDLALNDLNDVDTSGVQDGDILIYDSGTATWLADALPASTDEKVKVTSGSSNAEYLDDLLLFPDEFITKDTLSGGGGAEYLNLTFQRRALADWAHKQLLAQMGGTTFTNLGYNSFTLTSPTAASNGDNTNQPGVLISTLAFTDNVASLVTADATTYFEWENIAAWKIQTVDVTEVRIWNCLTAGAPSAADTHSLDLVGFRFSTAVDTNWACVTQDVSGNRTVTDSGIAVATNTPYLLEIVVTTGVVRFYIDKVLVQTHTTNLPTSTTTMRQGAYITCRDTSVPFIPKRMIVSRFNLLHR